MQFALNKKLEHCALQQSSSEHIPNRRTILYITLASKRNQTLAGSRLSNLIFLLTKSECAAPEDICTQHPVVVHLFQYSLNLIRCH